MKQRLLVAAIGVPLLLVVLLVLPPVATTVLVCAIAAVAAYELIKTACKKPHPVAYVLTVLSAVVSVAVSQQTHPVWNYLPAALLIALSAVAVFCFGKEQAMPFADVAICVIGGAVLPRMYACIALLRMTGPSLVLMPFVIAFIGDTFSMLGGMAFGGKKMAPQVSPKKTWAGFFAGPVGSGLGMILYGVIAKAVWSLDLPLWYLAACGVVCNLIGQLGDLTTSLIKREVGVKDYSRMFLEHGGVLDRFDSILFISPVLYGLIALLGVIV